MARLHVFIKISSDDAFELKAQALNNDSRLKEAGISALKFVGDKNYIVDGEFALTPPPPPPVSHESERITQPGKKTRITIRMMNPEDAYQLIADHLNGDPRLKQAGISEVKPAKQQIAVPVSVPVKQAKQTPVKVKQKSKSWGCLKWGILLGVIGAIVVVGGLFVITLLSSIPVAPVASIATNAIVVPANKPTSTKTPVVVTPSHVPPAIIITNTLRPAATITKIPTLEPVLSCQPVQGVIVSDVLSCRYGPGVSYLYQSAFAKGNEVKVIGQADTSSGIWIYVQSGNGPKCWINSSSKFVTLDNDVACVESYYPEKAPLPIFNTSLFPAPANVQAGRSGDMVNISWIGYLLEPADRESENSPRYLLELWTCQAGKIVLTALGTSEEYADVKDEPGCSEPSHGQVFLAHKDGYIGPSYIPWP